MELGQHLFADVEGDPVVVLEDADDGSAHGHELAHFGVNLVDGSVAGSHEVAVLKDGLGRGDASAGHAHHGGSGLLVLLLSAGACQRELVLGGAELRVGGVIGGFGLVALLGGDDALLVEVLHALIGLLGDVGGGLGRAHHVLGRGDDLLAASTLRSAASATCFMAWACESVASATDEWMWTTVSPAWTVSPSLT